MAGSEHVRHVLAAASERLDAAGRVDGFDAERARRLIAAAGYARGVLDTLGAYLADGDRDELEYARDGETPEPVRASGVGERLRDPDSGPFVAAPGSADPA